MECSARGEFRVYTNKDVRLMNTLSDMFKWECLNEQEDQKHPDETLPSTSKCGSCDFESDDEENLNVHVKSKHEFSCEICELTFKYEEKLKTHMCRLTVANPTCGDYYTQKIGFL